MGNNQVKILIAGEGGQGIQTIAEILANVLYHRKFHVCTIPHYGVEMRTGISLVYIIVSKTDINAFPKFFAADVAAVLSKRDFITFKNCVKSNTKLINATNLADLLKGENIPQKSLNMLVLGIIVKLLLQFGYMISDRDIIAEIQNKLSHHQFIKENIIAYKLASDVSRDLYQKDIDNHRANIPLKLSEDAKKKTIILPNYCKGCGLCLVKCPVNAISWDTKILNYLSRPIPKINLEKCIACKICENICPDCAIKIDIK